MGIRAGSVGLRTVAAAAAMLMHVWTGGTALAGGTAQLPLAAGRYVPQPRRTEDAIHSGCLQAQAGAIERMFRQLADQPGALCLLGGGAADSFAGLLEIPIRRVENLALSGLGTLAGQTAAR